MLIKERHYAILTYLNRYERATVSHLAKILASPEKQFAVT